MGFIKCSKCGADVDDQYKFCSECGAPIEKKAEEAVAPVEEKMENAVSETVEKAEEIKAEAEAVSLAPVVPPVQPVEEATAAAANKVEEAPIAAAAIFAQPQAPVQPVQPAQMPPMPQGQGWQQPVPGYTPIPQQPAKPKKQKKVKNADAAKKGGAGKIAAVIGVIVVALALILGGVYFLFLRDKDSVDLPEYTQKSFCKALDKTLKLDEDSDYNIRDEGKTTEVVSTSDVGFVFTFVTYKNESKAQKGFDSWYNMITGEDFEGDYTHKGDSGEEYITFDGEYEGDYSYGGIYLSGNTVLVVYTDSSKKGDIKDVNEFLEALEYPLP